MNAIVARNITNTGIDWLGNTGSSTCPEENYTLSDNLTVADILVVNP